MISNWNADRKLNVFILGPMPESSSIDSSCAAIKHAMNSIIAGREVRQILSEAGTSDWEVLEPSDLKAATITNEVFSKIDTADLVIVNVSPKDGSDQFSPNVFYELGLVHCLGVPYILLCQRGARLPFYLRDNNVVILDDFTEPTIRRGIEERLVGFLRGWANLSSNRISEFYSLPVVDISAVAGAGSSYYENMIRRSLLENGFISHHQNEFTHLIVCRPSNILGKTAVEEQEYLKTVIHNAGGTLTRRDLSWVNPQDKRGLSGTFVGTVMIDLPSIAYTLRMSPRFRVMRDRLPAGGKDNDRVLRQANDRLLERFRDVLDYYCQRDHDIRTSALTLFLPVEEVPQRLKDLGVI